MLRTMAHGVMLLLAILLPIQGLTQPHSQGHNPLQPADTSSPKDTFRSFLRSSNEGVRLRLSGAPRDDPKADAARTRALETLDFSQVADGHLQATQVERALLLKEVLDRIVLPLDEEIPGDQEVAERGIRRWSIPGTRIVIALVEDGPREGEFVFSADTVEQVTDMYQRVEHLPYQPGAYQPGAAEGVGVYETFYKEEGRSARELDQVRNRLKSVDTSSPRSSFAGLVENLERAYWIIMDADNAFRTDPPTITRREAVRRERDAAVLIRRAVHTLDLAAVPTAIREDVGIEIALQLKDVLDRIPRPYLESIPDEEIVQDWKRTNKDVLSITPRPFSWRVPNTEIEIVEMTDGPRAGEFLFSADTVKRAGSFFAVVQDLPYRPGSTEDFYTFFISTPGYLIPDAHRLARWFDDLPEWSYTLYADQTVWQWVGLGLALTALFVGAGLAFMAVSRVSRNMRPVTQEWLKLLVPVVWGLVVLAVNDFINYGLNITGNVLIYVGAFLDGFEFLLGAWIVYLLCKAIAEAIVSSPRIPEEGIDASLLRLAARVVGILLGAWVAIQGLRELGVHIAPLLAGLGVGGLALALAARPTIANIIGSFMIFADRPYRVGQRVNVLGQNGTVEEIGLRSTRIRLLTGHLTTIPNEIMASVEVENIGLRPHIRRVGDITITYDTPPEKIERAVEVVREILAVPEATDGLSSTIDAVRARSAGSEDEAGADSRSDEALEAATPRHPNEAINQPDFPPRVFFNEFNADSLNIQFFYWYHPAVYWDFLEHAHWVNVQIMERFNAEGIDFAFPTQTLHLAGDEKRAPITVEQRRAIDAPRTGEGPQLVPVPGSSDRPVPGRPNPAEDSGRTP